MNIFSVAVMSDDFEKSISFAKHLGGSVFKEIKGTRDSFILEHRDSLIRVMMPFENNRGYRHNKIYVDSNSPKAVEMALEIFRYKTTPIYFPNFKVEIKNPMEFIDFNKEIERYNQIVKEMEK